MRKQRSVLYITLCMIVITATHLLVPHHKIYLHVLLRFFYIIPIMIAGKSGGRWYGLSSGVLSAVLYSPHFMFKEAPMVFHIEGAVWIAVFCVVGYVSGIYSDIKRNYLNLRYEDVSVDRKHMIGSILFYADDTPITTNCAAWLAYSGLLEKESKLIVLYGPSYADAASGESSLLSNESISLSKLKEIIKDAGISNVKVDIKFIETGKQEKLSRKIIETAESSLCNLILIGKHPLSKSQEFLFGDTAISLIRKSTVPIIVVPNR